MYTFVFILLCKINQKILRGYFICKRSVTTTQGTHFKTAFAIYALKRQLLSTLYLHQKIRLYICLLFLYESGYVYIFSMSITQK